MDEDIKNSLKLYAVLLIIGFVIVAIFMYLDNDRPTNIKTTNVGGTTIINDLNRNQLTWNNIKLVDNTVYNDNGSCTASNKGMSIYIPQCTAGTFSGKNIEQEAILTSNRTEDTTYLFIYEGKLESGKLYYYHNYSHTYQQKNTIDQPITNYLVDNVVNYTDLGIPDARCERGNTHNTKMYLVNRQLRDVPDTSVYCFSTITVVNATSFRVSGNISKNVISDVTGFKFDYDDITNIVSDVTNNMPTQLKKNFSFYKINDIPVGTYNIKWVYTPKDNAISGKFHILAYPSSKGIAQAYNDNDYMYNDPAWNSSFNYQLVAYYTLNDSAGNSANNSVPYGLNGTIDLSKVTVGQAGIIGNGINVTSGTSNDYAIDFPTGTMASSTSWTISMWTLITNCSYPPSQGLAYNYQSNDGAGNRIILDICGTYGVFGKYTMWDGSFKDSGVWTPQYQWTHSVIETNGTDARVIVNGTTVGNWIAFSSKPLKGDSAQAFGIGQVGIRGKFDEIAIWNRTLTLAEISDLYNGGAGVTYTQNATATDTDYPIFSNLWDNNGTVLSGGNAKFNVTITNTNGTVYLSINGTNYYASNTSLTSYNVTVSGLLNKTYTYNWTAFGNGTSHNSNTSDTRSYTVLPIPTLTVNVSLIFPNSNNLNYQKIYFNSTIEYTNSNLTNYTLYIYNSTNNLIYNITNSSIDIVSSSNICYQETANVSTSCGGLNTGSYGFTDAFIYINYTKPVNAISGNWRISSGRNPDGSTNDINITIPNDCFNSKVEFRYYVNITDTGGSPIYVGSAYGQCKNSTNTWKTLLNKTSLSYETDGSTNFGNTNIIRAYDGNYGTSVNWENLNGWGISLGDLTGNYSNMAGNLSLYDEGIYWTKLPSAIITTSDNKTLTDDSYKWAIYACSNDTGSLSTCTLSSNATFKVDTLNPTLVFNSPTGNNYTTTIPANISLSVTTTDINIDSCYFVTNELTTNQPNTCNSTIGVIFNKSGIYNITYYVNDTLGHINSSTVSYLINYLRPNVSYTTTTIEGDTNVIYFNLTADNITTITANVTYYNDTYPMSLISSNLTSASFFYSAIAPDVTNDTIINLNVSYVIDGYNFTTTSYNQTVQDIQTITTNCKTPSLLFYVRDEENLTNLSATFDYNLYYGTNSTQKLSYGTLTGSNLSLCVNTTVSPNWTISYGEIVYKVSNYYDRRYYIFNGTVINNVTQTIYLYDLKTTSGTSFQVTIQDNTLVTFPNKYTALIRWYPALNSYTTVDMGKTDNQGQTVIHVKTEDVDYRVGVYEFNGTLLYLASPIRFVCQTSPCSYTLTMAGATLPSTAILKVNANLYYNDTDKIVKFIWNDASLETKTMNLTVYSITPNNDNVAICSKTGSGVVGVLSCNMTGYTTGKFYAVAQRQASPWTAIANIWIDLNTTFVQLNPTIALFLTLIILTLGFLIGVGTGSGVMVVIFGIVSLIPALAIGAVALPFVIGIAILGGVIIHFIRKQ